MSYHKKIEETSSKFYVYRTRLDLSDSVNSGTVSRAVKGYKYAFTLRKDLGKFHPISVWYHLASYTGTWNVSASILPTMAWRDYSISLSSNWVGQYVISNMAAINFQGGLLYTAVEDENVNFYNNIQLINEGQDIWVRNSSESGLVATTVMVDIFLKGLHIKI